MEIYNLTEAQLKEGCKKCIENVQNLLDSAKLLLNNENSHQYALGLYVYAFEEFGKAEILKDHRIKNEYSFPSWIFGKGRDKRKAHFRKLSEAFKKLPPVCRELSNTIKIKITYDRSDIPQTIIIMKDNVPIGSISIPSSTSGIFEDGNIPKPNLI